MYALLGQLTLRSWSAYELTQHMQRATVRHVWPRAESRIYDQLKRLAELGFASAVDEATGRRPRTVYSITDAGRLALREWLDDDDPAPYRLEDELLLRLSLCDAGDLTTLRRNLQRARRHLIAKLEAMVELNEQLSQRQGRFPRRSHISAVMAAAAYRQMAFRAELYDSVDRIIDTWPSTAGDENTQQQAIDSMGSTADAMRRLLEEQRRLVADS